MAQLTPVTLAQAVQLGELFGLAVTGFAPILSGVNSNFELQLSGGGRAFMQVREAGRYDEVAAQCRLARHLAGAGVPTPPPFALAAQPPQAMVAEHRGKPVVMLPFRPGSCCCQAQVTPHHTRQVGAALAAIHRAGRGYEGAPPSRFAAAELRRRLAAYAERSLEPALAADVQQLCAKLDELEPRVATAPRDTVIHGDLFRDNVLFGPDRKLSAVLDFELAATGSAVFDLAVALLAWGYGDRLLQPLCQALLAGYEAVRPLAGGELCAFFDQARYAALCYAVTRIGDYELRPRELIRYKDYRRFVRRLAAVEALGPQGFARFIRS